MDCRCIATVLLPHAPRSRSPSRSRTALTCGFGVRRCRSGDTTTAPARDIAVVMPMIPAPVSQCPMRDFAASSTSVSRKFPPFDAGQSTAVAAPTSMGSPRDVPVPCISSCPMCAGSASDTRSVFAISICCEGPFGAVRELERPSWFTPLPIKTAEAPVSKGASLLICTTPQHSPRP